MSSPIFPLPLYHGTSTLFLPDNLSAGLGGKYPLEELRIFEFVRELDPFVQTHLSSTDTYKYRSASWSHMVHQRSEVMNFQHGQTYLTPSISTAVRYAANKRCGSELLTYALEFLQMLVDRDVPSVRAELFAAYPRVFSLLDISPAPILFRVDGIAEDDLLGEDGGPPDKNLAFVQHTPVEWPDSTQEILQQSNFRLRAPIPITQIRCWIVGITKWHGIAPEYNLYQLSLAAEQSAL